jgi:predicted DNA-binding transcriptional regulator YafY
MSQLASIVGASRATVFRDLALLGEVHVPIVTSHVNGEVRYRVLGDELPGLRPTARQLAALALLRGLADPLRGTAIVRELDDLRALLNREAKAAGLSARATDRPASYLGSEPLGDSTALESVRVAGPAARTPVDAVRAIDHAIAHGTKVELYYRGAHDERPSMRSVDPVQWRLCGPQLYLIAFDDRRNAWRTFKASRIEAVQMLMAKAEPHDFDEQALFGRSIRIWSGPAVDVAVRLSESVGRFVAEWPISRDQVVDKERAGSVVVRAKVAGTVEATRWVLGWGGEAEALEPPELRRRVAEQLRAAMARYGREAKGVMGVRKAKGASGERRVSRMVNGGRASEGARHAEGPRR